jgi:hypothetical protein
MHSSRLCLFPAHEPLHLATTAEARIGRGELFLHVGIILAHAEDLFGLFGSGGRQIAPTRDTDGVDALIVRDGKDEVELFQAVSLRLGEPDPDDGEDDDDVAGCKEGVCA